MIGALGAAGTPEAQHELATVLDSNAASLLRSDSAYQKTSSGTCFNLADLSFNDLTSSVRLFAPDSTSAAFRAYKGTNCSGGFGVVSALAGGSPTSNLNSDYDNSISSVSVIY